MLPWVVLVDLFVLIEGCFAQWGSAGRASAECWGTCRHRVQRLVWANLVTRAIARAPHPLAVQLDGFGSRNVCLEACKPEWKNWKEAFLWDFQYSLLLADPREAEDCLRVSGIQGIWPREDRKSGWGCIQLTDGISRAVTLFLRCCFSGSWQFKLFNKKTSILWELMHSS